VRDGGAMKTESRKSADSILHHLGSVSLGWGMVLHASGAYCFGARDSARMLRRGCRGTERASARMDLSPGGVRRLDAGGTSALPYGAG